MKHNPESVLEASLLSCSRGDNLLFENLNFSIKAGEIHQIQGVNGAGKTSLLRILCGLSQPESGSLSWKGQNIEQQREEYCGDLLFIGHQNGIKSELTPTTNLVSFTSIHGSVENPDIESILNSVGLYGHENTPCRFLSAGQKRRVAIARLYLSTAQLWILDEPITALDVEGIEKFQHRLEEHANQGGMVILTSHQDLQFGGVSARSITL
ncbi:MAG: heme exporter protein A [Parasphingorhabdus sp.]